MTRRELNRYRFLEELIKRTEEQIIDVEDRLQPHGPSMSGMPHSSTRQNTIENNIVRLTDLKNKLEQYRKEKAEVESFMESVSNYQIRLILQRRFVDGMDWKDIANSLGGKSTEDSVKKKCYRYLDSSEKNF